MGVMQYYRAINSVKEVGLPFVTVWDTTKVGVTSPNQISLPLLPTGTYNFKAYYNGVLLKTVKSHLDSVITFPDGGGEKELTIFGKIEGWQFNNSGDRLKILGVAKWGDLKLGNTGQYFNGCNNLSYILDTELNTVGLTNINSAFAYCNLEEFPAINFPEGLDFAGAWRNNRLVSFPLIDVSSGANFNYSWFGNALVEFPALSLGNGVNFRYAWNNNSLAMFPFVNMDKGTNFDATWGGNLLVSFPAINFPLGTNFNGAWRQNRLASFPLVNMNNAVTLTGAWYGNRLTTFPAIAFPNATACNDIFYGGIVFTDFAARNFNSMQSGSRFLSGSSRIPTVDYSELLISLANNNTKNNVTLAMASSKYNSTAIAARNALIARGWNISDAGLE